MSTAPAPKAPPTKPKKDRERERREKEKQHPPGTERLKTVVRRLPPNLPEPVFWQSVEAWVTDQTVTWKTYYPGKFRKRLNKENIPSRAYIAFRTEEQLALFGKEYDGHLYRDKAGHESYAIVEFAPYQKVPSEKKKPDARNATIEKDEDYISFLNALNSPASTEPVSIETLVAAIQPPAPPKTTPLLEALKAEKSALKDKESNLRNHPHYKEQPVALVTAPRKDDPKKKAGPVPTPKIVPPVANTNNITAPGAGSNKKSHKKGQVPNANVAVATPPHMIAQKAPSQIQTIAKNVHPPPAPKSPKTSKAPRLPPHPKPAPAVKVIAASNPEAPVAALPAPGGQVAPAPTPRRSRPVVGLASRQFEAALNGAGVSAPGDRKSRREREREREKEREKEAVDTPSSVVPGGGPVTTDSKPTHVSPRKDRGGRKESLPPSVTGAEAAGGAEFGGPLESTKVPGILQRIDEPSALDTVVPVVEGIGGLTHDAGAPPLHGGRGGRRGRGRGRGPRGG